MKQRDDYGASANDYFDACYETVKPLALDLRSLVLKTVPKVIEVIKWGVPVYLLPNEKMWFCSIRAAKDHVTLQFGIVGVSLDDPQGLLEGTGKKLRHLKIRTKSGLKLRSLKTWIRQAASHRVGKRKN